MKKYFACAAALSLMIAACGDDTSSNVNGGDPGTPSKKTGIAHAGDGGDHAGGLEGVARIVPHRPGDDRPLVPGRAEEVGVAAQARVVAEHLLLLGVDK